MLFALSISWLELLYKELWAIWEEESLSFDERPYTHQTKWGLLIFERLFQKLRILWPGERLSSTNISEPDTLRLDVKNNSTLLWQSSYVYYLAYCEYLWKDFRTSLDEAIDVSSVVNEEWFWDLVSKYLKMAFDSSIEFTDENYKAISESIAENISFILERG